MDIEYYLMDTWIDYRYKENKSKGVQTRLNLEEWK